eukprot:g3710.t1
MVAIRSARTKVAQTLRGLDLSELRVRLVDAENQIVGHLSQQLALILQGKDKPIYTPARDTGDVCLVVNASKVLLTGKKWDEKVYRWHTGYPGGLRERTAKRAFWKRPEDVLWRSVCGMLPKNKLLNARLKKLLIYPGPNHNIKEVEFTKWEMPEKVAKRLSDKGKIAPPPKGSFKKSNN